MKQCRVAVWCIFSMTAEFCSIYCSKVKLNWWLVIHVTHQSAHQPGPPSPPSCLPRAQLCTGPGMQTWVHCGYCAFQASRQVIARAHTMQRPCPLQRLFNFRSSGTQWAGSLVSTTNYHRTRKFLNFERRLRELSLITFSKKAKSTSRKEVHNVTNLVNHLDVFQSCKNFSGTSWISNSPQGTAFRRDEHKCWLCYLQVVWS